MKTFDNKEAKELAEQIIEAKAELSRYLSECFPAGASCGVMLTDAQKTPTKATIFSVMPTIFGGEVCVQIDTAKPRSRQRYRSIPARYVFDVKGGAA